MEIITCYTADIKSKIKGEKKQRVDKKLMKATADVCLKALRYCTDIFLSEWDYLSEFSTQVKAGVVNRNQAANALIHSTDRYPAKFSEEKTQASRLTASAGSGTGKCITVTYPQHRTLEQDISSGNTRNSKAARSCRVRRRGRIRRCTGL